VRVRIATGNSGKLREFREMLTPLGYEVLGLEDVLGFSVEEDGATFLDNAIKKARALAERTGEPAIADDSGLVVDALDGAPGIYSARYAGEPPPGTPAAERDAANRRKLTLALADVPDAQRTARFVCALCYFVPDRPPVVVEGTCEGMISRRECGGNGFGYDPLFIVPAYGRTMAELAHEQKNALSHRGQALRRLLAIIAPGSPSGREGKTAHKPVT